VSPAITLQDFGIDPNVYNSDIRQTTDFTFNIHPTVDATAKMKRGAVALRSATDFVYYAEQVSERSVNEDFAASAQLAMQRITLLAAGTYLNTRERPNDEIDARSRRIERSGTLGLRLALAPRVALGASGRSEQTRFDGDAIFDGTYLAQELNRDTRTFSGSLNYKASPLTTLSVTAETSRILFTDAPVRDATSWQTIGGLDFNPRALLSGTASLGYQQFQSLRGTLPEFDGLVGSGKVYYRLAPGTRLGFSYERNLDYSYSDDDPYYVRQGYGGSVRRQILDRWDVELGGGRFRHHYQASTYQTGSSPVAPVIRPTREDLIVDGTFSLGYQARPGTRVVVALIYSERESNVILHGYNNLRLAASFAYGF
jgi:hypothetical protein